MTPIVTRGQLCEHLKPDGLAFVDDHFPEFDSVIIPPDDTASRQYCRIDRVPGGFVVHHGKYRELQQMRIP